MPFSQQMTIPRVLSLRTTPDGIRLFTKPVEEVNQLRGREHGMTDVTLGEHPVILDDLVGDLFDIELVLNPGDAESIGLDILGHRVEYSAISEEISALGYLAPLQTENGQVSLRILVDRTSVEIFANGGRIQLAGCVLPDDEQRDLSLYATGGKAKAASIAVWELRSIWNP